MLSKIAKLSAVILTGLSLTGCGPTDVERGLTRAMGNEQRMVVPLLVHSVECGAPKNEKRACMVSFVHDAKLPDTLIQIEAPKDTYPESFSFTQSWQESALHLDSYAVTVSTPLNGETMALQDASRLLAAAVVAAVNASKEQLGEKYVTRATAYQNLSSY